MEGNKIFLPFIYGSTAKQLDHPTAQEHTHKWKIHVRGISNSDLSPFIRKVTFKLHESFNNPLRTIDSFPFEIQETGWGEFEIQIRIYFHEPHDKSLSFSHFLRLYPSSDTFGNGDEQDPISSPISSKMVICEKYDEIAFVQPSENLKERIEAFVASTPALPHAEPLLWKAMERELSKVKQVITDLKEHSNKL